MKNKIEKIGILGGTFDPAHRGHVAISKEAENRFSLKKIYWAVTKKNPFKTKTSKNLIERIKYAKKMKDAPYYWAPFIQISIPSNYNEKNKKSDYSQEKIKLEFEEKEKKFDPEKVYKGQPNPTKL